ncbi:DUF6455 family protein [Pseudooceanicola sp. LIPI14-2-Ac024]|uniref:DUF6455 family protein n=1 Tax=Pseudooceanicola sp. LIPI14-2-Ac024 TaxID=3344875 RepID=UPI0035D0DF34
MGFIGKLDRAAVLYGGMAERLGVDPAADLARMPETAGAFRAAILRCAACAEAEACAGWQVENAQAGEAPRYCRNRGELQSHRA